MEPPSYAIPAVPPAMGLPIISVFPVMMVNTYLENTVENAIPLV